MPVESHEQNRLSWNAASQQHNLHKGDQARFFRAGGTTLYPEDRELIGDAQAKSVVHLQCNCGQDSLSIASELGAVVTGVDISDYAIDFAAQLSLDSGIPATFERADVFDWCERSDAPQFDIAYVSYGTIGWLSDITRWGRCVERVLKPGGRLAFIEFHPAFFMFDEDDRTRLKYDYGGGTLVEEEDGVGDYVGLSGEGLNLGHSQAEQLMPFVNPHPARSYCWGIGDVVGALTAARLCIDALREYPFSNGWKPYPEMRDLPGNRKAAPEGEPVVPMMYSIAATKPLP